MDRTDFIASLAECTAAEEKYFRAAAKSSLMLRKCAQHPLTFDERFALLSQEIVEMEAFRVYLDAKRFLHDAARCGYEGLSTL